MESTENDEEKAGMGRQKYMILPISLRCF